MRIARIPLFYLICLALLLVTAGLTKGSSGLDAALAIGAISAPCAWLVSWGFVRAEGASLESIGARPDRASLAKFSAGYALGLALIGLHALALRLWGHTHLELRETTEPARVFVAFCAYFLLAMREELTFHGYLLRRLASLSGKWIALAVISVMFAAEHVAGGATWASALAGAAVGSLLFGVASLVTRGLALPIGIHAAWNFGDWMRSSGGKGEAGVWVPVIQPGFESCALVVGWVAYLALFLATLLILERWGRREKATQPIRP